MFSSRLPPARRELMVFMITSLGPSLRSSFKVISIDLKKRLVNSHSDES